MTTNQPTIGEVIQKKKIHGLTSKEAEERLQAEGLNELSSAKPQSILAIAWGVVSEPMFLLLLSCGIIYLLIGNLEDADFVGLCRDHRDHEFFSGKEKRKDT